MREKCKITPENVHYWVAVSLTAMDGGGGSCAVEGGGGEAGRFLTDKGNE